MLAAVLTAVLCLGPAVAVSVWPQPVTLTTGQETVWLDAAIAGSFKCGTQQRYSVQCDGSLQGPNWNSTSGDLTEDRIVLHAIQASMQRITATSFVPWKFHHRGEQYEPQQQSQGPSLLSVDISQTSCPSQNTFDPQAYFAGDESYEITIDTSQATIKSNSSLGTLRALESLNQLVYRHSGGTATYITDVPIHIVDQPRWSHRAVSLDIARNAYGTDSVLSTIDAMASAKFSRLHLHATDSQSWPLEIPALPELAAKGAYQPNLVWSVDDLELVQAYGASKGVAVVVELDMPGHTGSIWFSQPDLVVAFNESDWSTFAAEPNSGQLKLNSTAVYSFLDQLFGDLLPRLTKYSPIYHMGGDEFNSQVYLLDETVQSNKSAVLQPLVDKFMSHVHQYVQQNNLRPMVWEEMVLEWNISIPNTASPSATNATPTANVSSPYPTGALVQVWKSSDDISAVVKKGYSAIFGDYNNWYLDCGFGGFLNPYPSGRSPVGVPYNTSGGVPTVLADPYLDYCNPMKNWRHIYVYDPLQNITDPAEVKLVEGGEVLLWSEQSDPVDLDFKLWPRAAAAAEVLWAGPRNASMIEEASTRLGQWRERLVYDVGVKSSPVQMTWCLMEGGCVL